MRTLVIEIVLRILMISRFSFSCALAIVHDVVNTSIIDYEGPAALPLPLCFRKAFSLLRYGLYLPAATIRLDLNFRTHCLYFLALSPIISFEYHIFWLFITLCYFHFHMRAMFDVAYRLIHWLSASAFHIGQSFISEGVGCRVPHTATASTYHLISRFSCHSLYFG